MPDDCGTNLKSRLFAVSVFVLGGRFHLHIRFIEEMNGLLGVASQVTLVHFVRFVDFLDGFLNMLLGFSKIRMRCGINIAGALREYHTSKDQANCEACGEKNVAMFHASVSLYLRGSGISAASSRFQGSRAEPRETG